MAPAGASASKHYSSGAPRAVALRRASASTCAGTGGAAARERQTVSHHGDAHSSARHCSAASHAWSPPAACCSGTYCQELVPNTWARSGGPRVNHRALPVETACAPGSRTIASETKAAIPEAMEDERPRAEHPKVRFAHSYGLLRHLALSFAPICAHLAPDGCEASKRAFQARKMHFARSFGLLKHLASSLRPWPLTAVRLQNGFEARKNTFCTFAWVIEASGL